MVFAIIFFTCFNAMIFAFVRAAFTRQICTASNEFRYIYFKTMRSRIRTRPLKTQDAYAERTEAKRVAEGISSLLCIVVITNRILRLLLLLCPLIHSNTRVQLFFALAFALARFLYRTITAMRSFGVWLRFSTCSGVRVFFTVCKPISTESMIQLRQRVRWVFFPQHTRSLVAWQVLSGGDEQKLHRHTTQQWANVNLME